MPELILNGERFFIEEGVELKDKCEEAGVPFSCEEGVCGTCLIEFEGGKEYINDFTQEEHDFLGEPGTERLACQCKIKEGVQKENKVIITY